MIESKSYIFDRENLINLLLSFHSHMAEHIHELVLKGRKHRLTEKEALEQADKYIEQMLAMGEVKAEDLLDRIDDAAQLVGKRGYKELVEDILNKKIDD